METEIFKEKKTADTNGLSIAALVLSILSFFSLGMIFPVFILGGISIILALLSRGKYKMAMTARLGFIFSTISIVICTFLVTAAISFILSNPAITSKYTELYNQMYDYYYNDGEYPDLNEFINELDSIEAPDDSI